MEALLHQALGFKPEERAVFLAGACGRSPDLRQRVKAWSYETTSPFGEPGSLKLHPVKAVHEPTMRSVTTVHLSRAGDYLAWFEAGPANPSGLGRDSNGQARVLNLTAIRQQLAELGLDWND